MRPIKILSALLLLAGITAFNCQAERFLVNVKVTCNMPGEGTLQKENLNNQKLLQNFLEDNPEREDTVNQLAIILDTETTTVDIVRRSTGQVLQTILNYTTVHTATGGSTSISRGNVVEGDSTLGSIVLTTKTSGAVPKINADFQFSEDDAEEPVEVCVGTIVSTGRFVPTNPLN